MPAAAALAVLALPLVATLFHYGRFTVDDAWMTRQALVAYSVGLVGMILVKILAPGFYARQNVATPVKIGICDAGRDAGMNFAFVGPLKHAGLALAIGLGACLNAVLLYLISEKARNLSAAARLAGCSLLKVARRGGGHGRGAAVHRDGRSRRGGCGAAGSWKVPAVLGLVVLGARGLRRLPASRSASGRATSRARAAE